MNNANFLSIQSAPPTMPDQFFSLPLCLAVLSAHGVSRATLMCGDTWQARWPLGLSLITLDPNPSGIKPAKPNSHCGSWLASAGTAAEGEDIKGWMLPKIRREMREEQLGNWSWKIRILYIFSENTQVFPTSSSTEKQENWPKLHCYSRNNEAESITRNFYVVYCCYLCREFYAGLWL